MVKILLSCGTYTEFAGKKEKYFPLHSAILNEKPELVALLVNRENVDLNTLTEKYIPLQLTISVNRKNLVEIFLTDKRMNPDLNTNLHSRIPLFEAVLKNNETIANLLSSAGADPEIKDTTGFAPSIFLNVPSTVTSSAGTTHRLFIRSLMQ